jgi:hypothetical protein
MSVFYDLASLVLVPSGYKSGKVYSQKPQTTDGQLTFTRASTATRVNASGLIEAVASGVPRLDYLNSTCPKLLLEPQRTNDLVRSSEFENAAWAKIGGSTTANAVSSPDGTTNADTFTENTNTTAHYLYNNSPISVSAGAYTASIFAKAGTRSRLIIGLYDGTSADYQMVQFDLNAGTIVEQAVSGIAKIENYGNGWYRCSVTRTLTAAPSYFSFGPHTNTNLPSLSAFPSYLGTGGTINLYGAQLELGAYGTSLIPTTTAAVTRVADAASKTGVSSLIGQTEGTIFGEFANPAKETGARYFSLSDGTAGDRIDVYAVSPTEIGLFAAKAFGVIINTSFAVPANAPLKYAIAYKAGQWAWYLNGVQVGTSTNTNVPTMSAVLLTTDPGGGVGAGANPVNQALLFKTRLTNAQLAELTSL